MTLKQFKEWLEIFERAVQLGGTVNERDIITAIKWEFEKVMEDEDKCITCQGKGDICIPGQTGADVCMPISEIDEHTCLTCGGQGLVAHTIYKCATPKCGESKYD